MSSSEDFFGKFQGWAYFGYTGYFRGGTEKSLNVQNSYACESNLSPNFDFLWNFTDNYQVKTATAPAGSVMTLLIKFKDTFGYTSPHFQNRLVDCEVSF